MSKKVNPEKDICVEVVITVASDDMGKIDDIIYLLEILLEGKEVFVELDANLIGMPIGVKDAQ